MDICSYESAYFDHPVYRISISVVYSASSLIATTLNFLILVSIWKTPSLHNPSFMLIANLALSDFINGTIGEPFMVCTNYVALKKQKHVFCYIWKIARAVTYCTASVSLQTLALISIDRLLAVKLLNRYRSVVTLKRVAKLLIIWWIGSLCLANLIFLNVKIENLKHLLIMIEVFMFVLLSTVSFCYTMAFFSLRKITSSISPDSSSDPNTTRPNIDVSKYRKSLTTMIVVFTVIMISYLPYVCIALATAVSFDLAKPEDNQFLYQLFLGSELVMVSNSSLNPLIYLWRMGELREVVKTTVKKILRLEHSANNQ
ncbi:trace amine-associated receptor 9-like [Actinia tenebrosa]|uniref:Trace amine-associated receptor 9-like n=1 Tax=Actinia tenebrosa TaxID=6105 RepID=A0A6P8I7S7_ACTTE|nr:trace amine-associated receptor 9-like [Actinia tenebrosa]